jgi:hypothetical protein
MFALFKEIMILKLRKVKWAGNVARMGGYQKCMQSFGQKPQG